MASGFVLANEQRSPCHGDAFQCIPFCFCFLSLHVMSWLATGWRQRGGARRRAVVEIPTGKGPIAGIPTTAENPAVRYRDAGN